MFIINIKVQNNYVILLNKSEVTNAISICKSKSYKKIKNILDLL